MSEPRPRLLLLNGPPGIGKSTLARRWAAEHPATLCCDVDVLRTMIGGWREDFKAAGGLIRPVALAMIGAHLHQGHDVVLPQLIAREEELARFEQAAGDAGAGWHHVMLTAEEDETITRFHARGVDTPDPWHDDVRRIVAAQGGDDVLRRYRAMLADLVRRRTDVTVVATDGLSSDETYRNLTAAVSR